MPPNETASHSDGAQPSRKLRHVQKDASLCNRMLLDRLSNACCGAQTPYRPDVSEMTIFHADEYVNFLRTITPDNMHEYSRQVLPESLLLPLTSARWCRCRSSTLGRTARCLMASGNSARSLLVAPSVPNPENGKLPLTIHDRRCPEAQQWLSRHSN